MGPLGPAAARSGPVDSPGRQRWPAADRPPFSGTPPTPPGEGDEGGTEEAAIEKASGRSSTSHLGSMAVTLRMYLMYICARSYI